MEEAGGGEVGVSVIPDAQVLTGFLFFSGEMRRESNSVWEKSLLSNLISFLLGFFNFTLNYLIKHFYFLILHCMILFVNLIKEIHDKKYLLCNLISFLLDFLIKI